MSCGNGFSVVQSLKRRQDGHRFMSSSADAVLMKEGIAAKSPVFAAAEIVARDTHSTLSRSLARFPFTDR